MFSNIDRKRIYQEEVYRYEVRTQLDKTNQKKIKGKTWTFVNSAFFLWFLSSVVVGIISFSYAKWDKQREIEREHREQTALLERENIHMAKKLDAEISSRLNYFVISQFITLVESPRDENIKSIATIITSSEVFENPKWKRLSEESPVYGRLSEDGIMSLDDPNAIDYKVNVYPEYANRNLRSLLLELEDVVPPEQKNEITLAYKQSIKAQAQFLSVIEAIRVLKKKGKPGYHTVTSTELKEFCEAFNLKRWGEPVPITNEVMIVE